MKLSSGMLLSCLIGKKLIRTLPFSERGDGAANATFLGERCSFVHPWLKNSFFAERVSTVSDSATPERPNAAECAKDQGIYGECV